MTEGEASKRIARLAAELRWKDARLAELEERTNLLLQELGRLACGVGGDLAFCACCGQVLVCTADMDMMAHDYREGASE